MTNEFDLAMEPFRELWHKLRITYAAVLRDGWWISFATRIALSHLGPEREFFLQPKEDFIVFSSDAPLADLPTLCAGLERGKINIESGNQSRELFLTLPHAKSEPNAQQLRLPTPYSNCGRQYNEGFAIGASFFQTWLEPTYLMSILSQEQSWIISSKLRLHTPPFNGMDELLSSFNLPRSNNFNTAVEVIAPFPFAMAISSTNVIVTSPEASMGKVLVIGFFNSKRVPIELSIDCNESQMPPMGTASGPIPWPEQSKSGELFLYFRDQMIGSIPVRRWLGTTNWRIQVQNFFDPSREILKQDLEARKDQREFEHAVARLLNELQIPAVWHGSPKYHDLGDLTACIELKKSRIVLLGECTVQKPSVKFTPLLTRKKELEKQFDGEVRVLPVVFTSSTLSSADKEQAGKDGIALVGSDELSCLMSGFDQEWGPEQVIKYFDDLIAPSLEIPRAVSGG